MESTSVEPTGPIMDDPNLTDKKYPGNPTKSYRSRQPLRVVGEITEWQGHSPERLQAMKDHIERLRQLGVEAIDDWVHSFTTVRCLAAVFEEKTQHLARSVWSSRIGVGAGGLPPDQAWAAPWMSQCSKMARPLGSAWIVRV